MLLKHKSGAAESSAGSWDILYPQPCPCFSPAHCHSVYLHSPRGCDNTSPADKYLSVVTRGSTGLEKPSPPLFPVKGSTFYSSKCKFTIPALHWGGISRLFTPVRSFTNPKPTQTPPGCTKPDPRMENQNNHHITEVSAWRRLNNPTIGSSAKIPAGIPSGSP